MARSCDDCKNGPSVWRPNGSVDLQVLTPVRGRCHPYQSSKQAAKACRLGVTDFGRNFIQGHPARFQELLGFLNANCLNVSYG